MTVEILFEKAFLFGDEANATYLRRLLPDARFVETDLHDRPFFADDKPDLIYMGAMSERNQKRAAQALLPFRERLRELIDVGVCMLFTGNAIDILGAYITTLAVDNVSRDRYDALGLFEFHTELVMDNRYYGQVLGRAEGMDLVGFKSQFGHMYGLPEALKFIDVQRGVGIHPGLRYEGIHKNNLYATYLVGPFLILNPPFAKRLLRLLDVPDTLPYEEVAMKAYEIRLAEFKDRMRNIG